MNFGLMHAEIKKSFELSQLNLMGKVIIKRMSNTMFLSAHIVPVVDQAHSCRWVVMMGLVKILKSMEKAGILQRFTGDHSLSVSNFES